MVGKLFKYEAKYYLRLFIPFGIIVLAAALFMRITYAFRSDSIIYDIVYGSSVVLYVISLAVCVGAVTVLAVTRFYKNLYGTEGYLSFTLPVTAAQHIWAKLSAALLFYLCSLFLAIVSFFVATAGELFLEYIKAAVYIFEYLYKQSGADFVLLFIEILVLLLGLLVFEVLLFYTCVSLGQMAKKAKVFMSFLWYFIYYSIAQLFGTIFIIVFQVLSVSGKMEAIIEFIAKNIDWLMHAFPITIVVFLSMFSLALFLANRSIMTKKLNLE